MAIRYNQTTLDKIIKVLEEAGYVLRFEKGSFNSGYCILEHKKVVVVNKFLDIEGRINTLADILSLLQIDPALLSPEARKTFEQLRKEAPAMPDTDTGEETPDNDQPAL